MFARHPFALTSIWADVISNINQLNSSSDLFDLVDPSLFKNCFEKTEPCESDSLPSGTKLISIHLLIILNNLVYSEGPVFSYFCVTGRKLILKDLI